MPIFRTSLSRKKIIQGRTEREGKLFPIFSAITIAWRYDTDSRIYRLKKMVFLLSAAFLFRHTIIALSRRVFFARRRGKKGRESWGRRRR